MFYYFFSRKEREEKNERHDDLVIYFFIVHYQTDAQYQASTMTHTPFRTTSINYSSTARFPLHRQMTTMTSTINAISSISIYSRSTTLRSSPTDRLQLVTDGSTMILCSPQPWLQRYYKSLQHVLAISIVTIVFYCCLFSFTSVLLCRNGCIS